MSVVIVSRTGEIHGAGSDPWKWVSRLTEGERTHVKRGGTVLVWGGSTHGGHPPWRKVLYRNGRYTHRVPTALECAAAERAINRE